MQDRETISVVIPNYNRANDLIKAINSALNQTYPVTEILVCDDGSSDNSRQLIEQLNNPKVKWIDCGKNGGPAIPRNIGVKTSSSNWIAFLDSDDEWLENKIEKQLNAIKANNVKASCTNASRIRVGEDKGSLLSYQKSLVTLQDLMLQNEVICSSALVSKDLLLKTSLFPEEKEYVAIEDFVLWVRLSAKTSFAFVNENLVKYFDNVETSIRASKKDDGWDVLQKVFSNFQKWLKTNQITLSDSDSKALKIRLKQIKQRGIPTAWEEFERKFRDKFGLSKKTN